MAKSGAVRPEIQALRALAVSSVVLYHLWPALIPGGYVGVDIFFAISGFLIIGHLLREVDRHRRVALASFWARRARRLLPASFLVVVATAVATLIWAPALVWKQWFSEMAASAGYVQNWLLAANSVDYLGEYNRASPTEHFWSLSVEEQFYLLVPLLVAGALRAGRSLTPPVLRRVIGGVLLLVTVVSFGMSVHAVATDPSPAYFITQSRAWEFGAGGLLAFVGAGTAGRRENLRRTVSWAGLLMLAFTLGAYSGATSFPGAAAGLPVLGTLAVIWAGMPAAAGSPSPLFTLRPVQWLGGVSYSFYLWHWAPIVVLPYVLGHDLRFVDRAAILLGALLLAWATKFLVEDPAREWRVLTGRPARFTLFATVGVTLLVVGSAVAVVSYADRQTAAAAAAIDAALVQTSGCVGASAMLPGTSCSQPFAVTTLTDPAFAKTDIGSGVQDTGLCKQTLDGAEVLECDIGDTAAPTMTIALIGDSHAGHLVEPLDLWGKQHHVRFRTFMKTWCAGTGADGVVSPTGTVPSDASCTAWGRAVLDTVRTDPDIQGAVFADYTSVYASPDPSWIGRPITAADYSAAWEPLLGVGKKIILVRDTPHATQYVPDCVAAHIGEYDPCTTSRADALPPPDQNPSMIAAAAHDRVVVVDLTDAFCDAQTCHSVIGGLIVYFDDHHMSSGFAKSLAVILGPQLSGALL